MTGFADAEQAAANTDSVARMLQLMYERRVDALPVIDDRGALTGIAELGRLMQGVVVELARQAEPARKE